MSFLSRWRIPLARVGARCRNDIATKPEYAITEVGEPVIISAAPREVRARVKILKGKPYVNIRHFVPSEDSPEKSLPTKKGVFLSVEQWEALKRSVGAVDDLIKKSQ